MKRKSIGLELMLGMFALAGPEYQNKSIFDFDEILHDSPPHNESEIIQNIIRNQSQNSKDQRVKSFAGDFILKCIEKRISKEKIILRLRSFYSMPKQRAEELYEEMEKILKEKS